MKRLAPLCLLLLLITVACSTRLFQPTDVGKTFGVVLPHKVPIFKEPSLQSEIYYLEDPEVFTTELAVCDGDKPWWWDCILIIANTPQKGFLKARFVDGDVGYVNFIYFFPDYATPLITERQARKLGYSVPGYIAWAKETLKKEEDRYTIAESRWRETVKSTPWPEDTKRLVLERRIKIGMTREQVSLSQNSPLNSPLFKPLKLVYEKVGPDGVREKWACGGTSYYFLNNRLVGWKTTDGTMKGNQRIESCTED